MFVLPALMLLIGKACWWLPGPVERHMPRIGIEGEAYFERLDAEKQGAAASESSPGTG